MSKAAINILIAALFFSLMGVCAKLAQKIPAYELVFFRSSVIVFICLLVARRRNISLYGKNKMLLVSRGVTGSVSLSLFFYTLQNMPMAYATTIQHLSPIFTILIAGFLLKEFASLKQWLFLLLAFSGVLLIKGFDLNVSTHVLMMGIASATIAGVAYNIIRKLAGEEPLVIVFYFQLMGLVLFTPFTALYWVAPIGVDWIYLILMGMFTYVAQILMTKAYQQEKASDFVHYTYAGVVYSMIWGYVIFAEKITFMAFCGIVIIIFSAIASKK